jgi:hypothetical protein
VVGLDEVHMDLLGRRSRLDYRYRGVAQPDGFLF